MPNKMLSKILLSRNWLQKHFTLQKHLDLILIAQNLSAFEFLPGLGG